MKNYKTFGVMLDMSRNAVMNVEALKKYMHTIKKMGYNTILLYCEDTYEVEDEPYFGYMRGRYSIDEIKEIDAFGLSIGMEVIPCIQTLSHLATANRWGQWPTDSAQTLMVGDERCYQLIDRMFATLSKCFTTKRIHVGMDEAFQLGRGRYFDKNGLESVDVIMKKHLARVTELAEKYDFELLMWSDMFFAEFTGHRYYTGKLEMPKQYLEAMPKSVKPVYWDYYHTKEQQYDDMMYNHKQFTKDFWFAGGAWSWVGFAPNNEFTLRSMIPALEACKKYRTKNVFFTMWGDNGAECSRYGTLPSLFYLAQYAKGERDEAVIKEKFEKKFGIAFDDFMLLDEANFIHENDAKAGHPRNPAKYALFADTFNGFTDNTILENGGEKYAALAEKLHEIAKKNRRFGYIFESEARLCDVLAIKYELGVKVRKAYQAGKRWDLELYSKRDYPELIRRVESFAKAFEKQWMTENKPQGFDSQDIRIGGLLRRLEYCRKTLNAYLDRKTDKIEELEVELLPFGSKNDSLVYNDAIKNMSVSVM